MRWSTRVNTGWAAVMKFFDPKSEKDEDNAAALHLEFWIILGIVALSWLQAIWVIL
jgi:hypothetical protein